MRILSGDYKTDIPYEQTVIRVKEGSPNDCMVVFETVRGESVYVVPGHFTRRQGEIFIRAISSEYSFGRKVCYLSTITKAILEGIDGYR